ncbi:hypothetical protein V499_08418 [Pseudogymnoascus sp. VKM F-103]|nr:hypothetical protein V499_08418 [Pseudogymnoascus sp. VKM F-103]
MRNEAVEEGKKASSFNGSPNTSDPTRLSKKGNLNASKPSSMQRETKPKENSRATDYILAHAPTTLSQGYPQAHEQHPHNLPYVRAPVTVSHWQVVVQRGVFVLDMETAGLVPVEGWKESDLALVIVSWDTPPPIEEAICIGLDIGAVGRRCSALACGWGQRQASSCHVAVVVFMMMRAVA